MRMALGLVASVLLLAGCTTTWQHSTKNETEFYGDDSECQARAQAVPYNPTGGNIGNSMRGLQVASIYERCMMGKGWAKVQ
jgi:protein involved in sex pheromone biosynthesis